MEFNTSELCDFFADSVDVVDPIFLQYGGKSAFYGQISTVKCFEDKALVIKALQENGLGKVLLVDGGGSTRRALIDATIAEIAIENNWEGIICYGSVRDVDILEDMDIGIQAVASIPVGAEEKGTGEQDIPVNFAGVTFLPEDHLYADSTGIILSPDQLEMEE